MKKQGYKSFKNTFFNYSQLRNCFLGCKYVTVTLQLRGVYGVPIITLKRLLNLYKNIFDCPIAFVTSFLRRILENCEFVAGPSGNSVKLPLCLTQELAFLSGVLHGDGTIDKEKIRISDGVAYGKYSKEEYETELKLIRANLEGVSAILMKIFKKDTTALACSKDSYKGIVITSKPLIRFFNKVLHHPIGSKHYKNGVWVEDKLVIPNEIKNCNDGDIIKAYICGMISSDGSVPRACKSTFRVYLSGISTVVHDIGKLISKRFGARVYFHKRRSKSRGRDYKDAVGNFVYRYEIILYDLEFIKEIFKFSFAYPSKKLRVMNLVDEVKNSQKAR